MNSQDPNSRKESSPDTYRGKYAQGNTNYDNSWSAYQRDAQQRSAQERTNPAATGQFAAQPQSNTTRQFAAPTQNGTGQFAAQQSQPDNAADANTDTATTETDKASSASTDTNTKKQKPQYVKRSQNKRRSPSKKVAAIVIALIVIVGSITGGIAYAFNAPINVTINGEQKTINGDERSPEGLVDNGIVSVKAGNYVAVDNSVIREGEGYPCTAVINGNEVSDLKTRINDGDTIEITDGTNIMEPYTDSDPQPAPCYVEETGVGAVHLYRGEGLSGKMIVRTGSESGKTTEIITKEPSTIQLIKYNIDTHGDKVIALTFDDGPWDSSTAAILDVLKENNAKATFFTVGERIKGHEDLIKRMENEGHEVATHSYDHAKGSGQGVSMDLMSSQERKDEVTKGLQAITDAGGNPSKTFRSPGGNFSADTARDVQGLISAEIGWNVDTGDWQRPGTDTIAKRIEMAKPGYILLMHDGGGDRSQTVEALKKALPKLVEQGYEFVTVDELIERYPYAS